MKAPSADGAPDTPWALISITRHGVFATASPLWRRSLVWASDGHGRFAVSDRLMEVLRWLPHERRDLRADFTLRWLTGTLQANATPYTHIHAVRPGTALRIDAAGQVTLEPWFAEPDLPSPTMRGDQAVQYYLDAFDATIDTLVDSQQELAIRMSGGLDSTFVATSMARHGRLTHAYVHTPPDAGRLTIGPGWVADDWSYAQDVRRYLSPFMELHAVNRPPDGSTPLDWGETEFRASGVPPFNSCNLAWLQDSAELARERGLSAIFGGGGGNAAFSDPKSLALIAAVRHRDVSLSARIAVAELHGSLAPSSVRAVAGKIRRGLRSGAVPIPGGRSVCRWLNDDADDEVRLWRGGLAAMAEWGRNHLVDRPPVLTSLTSNLPILDPFTSVAVVRAAASIADDEWIKGPAPRGFARRLGEGRVPDAVRLRRTLGAQGIDVWAHMQAGRLAYTTEAELLAESPLAEFLDVGRLAAAVRTWPWRQRLGPPSGDAVSAERVLVLARFLRWHRDEVMCAGA